LGLQAFPNRPKWHPSHSSPISIASTTFEYTFPHDVKDIDFQESKDKEEQETIETFFRINLIYLLQNLQISSYKQIKIISFVSILILIFIPVLILVFIYPFFIDAYIQSLYEINTLRSIGYLFILVSSLLSVS
jgi:hypothetical protein